MATEIKLRRGTTAQHASFNGAEGEVTYDTDKHTLIVHNNEGNGTGRQVALLSDVQAVDTLAEILALSNTTGGNNIAFGDSTGVDDDRLTFGAGADLQIYHDGSNSYVKDANVGNLVLQGTDIALRDNVGNRKIFCEDGNDKGVDVHFGNEGVKLKTTTDGIDVTGEVKGDSLDIDGNADISGNLVLGGDLNVTGTTTTVNQTNLDVSDNIIGLNRGASTNANDSGFIIERGSTGDNAVFVWDESADKFTLGTTTATPSSTGDLSITTGTLVANVEGNLTGNITGATTVSGIVTADGLVMGDDERIKLGDGTDFQIYHENSTDKSIIKENNASANLQIQGENINITNSNASKSFIQTFDNKDVALYSDGNMKLRTSDGTGSFAAGVNVTGTVTADGIQLDGNMETNGDITIQQGHKVTFDDTSGNEAFSIQVSVNDKTILTESGDGNFEIRANRNQLLNADASSEFFRGGDNDGVKIFGENKLRIATGNGTLNGADLANNIHFYTGDGDAADHRTMLISATGIDVTGTVTADAITLGDNEPITFNGNLEIKSNGNDSTITESGSGSLTIKGQNFFIRNADGQALFASAGGSVQLSHCPDASTSNTRLQTTTNGVTISGTSGLTAEQATINGTVTADAITSHQTTVVNSSNQTASNFYGQRMIHTGGAVTYTFAETGSISGTNIGKSVVVVNGGTADITCNITTSKFYKMISGIDTSYSGSGASSITISKGGVVEFIVSEQNKVLVLGSGI